MDVTPHWKRVWVTVNGRKTHIGCKGASTALLVTKNYLFNGINMYKPFSDTGYTSCWKKLSEIKNTAFMTLMRNMSVSLNLDTFTCFAMLCNYLKFECYVQVDAVQSVVDSALKRQKLVSEMWEFYTLERMYMLKLLACIIENYQNVKHPFQDIYKNLIEEETFKQIQKKLFEQYKTLLKEMTADVCTCERNYREQLQILFTILSTFVYEKCNYANFLYLLKLFKENNCCKWYNIETDSDEMLNSLKAIHYAEIAIFLSSLYNLWDHYQIWYDHYDEIEALINQLYQNWDSPIVPLAWVALHLSIPSEAALVSFEANLQQHLGVALQLDVFEHLQLLVTNDLFQGTSTGIMVKASVFTILEILCIKLGAHKIFVHPGTLKLVGELLKTPEIAAIWQESNDEGTKSFHYSSLYCFPYYFTSLSILAKSLIHLKDNAKEVVNAINELQLYTEHYEKNDVDGLEDCEMKISLTVPYRPLKNDLIVFPVGTKVTISKLFDDNVISYHGTYSYFSVLIHIINTLFDEIEKDNCTPMIEEAAIAGCRLLQEILEVDHNLISNNEYAKELSRLLYCLFCTVAKSKVVNRNLMILCFELTICELDKKATDTLTPLLHVKILPSLIRDAINPRIFADINNLSQSYLTLEICKDMCRPSSCHLTYLYIKMLMKCLKNNVTRVDVLIPGLMFVVVKMFPLFADQLRSTNLLGRKVCCKLLKLIRFILEHDTNLTENGSMIYNCIVELFLKKDPFISALHNICTIGNAELEILMSSEMNYKNGPLLKIAKAIKNALTCYLYLLRYVVRHENAEDYTVFKNHLWKSCFNQSFLEILRGYISHTHDSEIPQTIFEILGEVSLLAKKSLLHALKYNSTEARQWIMQCFCDPLLNEKTKVSIIHYITCCINEQSALIMAFFNIYLDTLECSTDDKEENMITCMVDYLKKAAQFQESAVNPLQLRILELFHILWKNNKQFVTKKVNGHKNFWSVITLPLLKVKNVSIYISLLTIEILVLEFNMKKDQVSDSFKLAIDSILEESKNFVQQWIERATEITKRTYMKSDRSTGFSLANVLLTVLKKFILIVRHFLPAYDCHWYDYRTEKQCLDTLLHCILHLQDAQLVSLSASLSLIFYRPKKNSEEEIIASLDSMCNLLVNFSLTYTNYDAATKTTVLTLAAMVLNDSETIITKSCSYATSFFLPFIRIYENEYSHIIKVKQRVEEPFYYSWVIILKVANKFLSMNMRPCDCFFQRSLYLKRLLNAMELYTLGYMPIRVAEVIMASLLRYAQSQFIEEFDLYCNKIRKNIQSHNVCKLDEGKSTKGIIPDNVKNNWKFYTYVMNLNFILLKERGIFVIQDMLLFVQSHQQNLADGILTATLIANNLNLQLVFVILHFLFEVFKYLPIVKNVNRRWFFLIMLAVRELLNMACQVLLRPTMLVSSSMLTPSSDVRFAMVSVDHLATITSRYMDIVLWVSKCLNRWNPSLVDLLDKYQSKFESFLDFDFRFPPPLAVHQHQLSYNMILYTLHYISKIIMDLLVRKKDPILNVTPSKLLPPDHSVIIYPQKDISNSISALFSETLPPAARCEDTWLMGLDPEKLTDALCTIGTLLATEIFYTSKRFKNMNIRTVSKIKWELSADLVGFYDFVHKYISYRMSHGCDMPRSQQSKQAEPTLIVDLTQKCYGRKGEPVPLSFEDSYLVLLVHWFREMCYLKDLRPSY